MDPAALGRYLRESREAKEITLEDAVRALRIRRDILESFEQGEFSVMDSTVRVRGMLRNYAHFLSLEEDRVLQYYESANSTKRRRRFGQLDTHVEPIAPTNITDTPPALPAVDLSAPQPPTVLSRIANVMGIIAMLLLSIAAVAVIAFVTMDLLDLEIGQADAVATPAQVAGNLTETPTNTPTITPRATILTDTPPPGIAITGVQVDVEIEQRSWMSITVDDREQFSGFLEPGYASSFVGNDSVIFRVANAAALNVTYNGIQQETFGARGQEVEIVFSTSGVDVMQSTVVPIIVTTLPTENVTLPVINPSAEANTVENQPTLVPTQAPPSPTPLFALNQSAPDEAVAQPQTTATESQATDAPLTTATATQPAGSDTDATQTPTQPQSTATPEPTSGAVLPIRETPANPTPTKTE